MIKETQAYQELQAYTLSHGDPAFIHQHVVDAWALQHADEYTKPITITFALVGLYLHIERGWSGRQVQRVHMIMGRRKRVWPQWLVPVERGSITVEQVMACSPGPERDRAIEAWCRSVWQAWQDNRPMVAELLREYNIQ